MLDWSWAADRPEAAHNYWLCTSSAAAVPHARPVWAVWIADRLCFSTDPASPKGRNLARDPRVTLHLESGDEVVILEGVAERLPDELAAPVQEAYVSKYAWEVTVDPSSWYAFRPQRAYAWTEQRFPQTATRFDF
jgi:pyridoxine/pyridoxamine 5'-phosphate oxidase